MEQIALVVGAGAGLSASVARALAARGKKVVLAARDTSDLGALAREIGADTVTCDAKSRADMQALFDHIDGLDGVLDVAVYNPSARARGAINLVDPEAVEQAMLVSAYGAFLMAHHASARMLDAGQGAMLFTGASAGIKGFPNSASFAMGKFALRGLCQSLARELHPQNIHIGHFVIDGGISNTPQVGRIGEGDGPDNMLDPDAIAASYMHLLDQHRSAWTWEVELRPWVEKF